MKKCKQVLSIFLALLMLVMSVPLAFAEGEPCTHSNMIHYAEGEYSRYNDNDHNYYVCIEHWYCDVCGRYFADAAGTQEVDYNQIFTIPCPHNDLRHYNEREDSRLGYFCVENWYCYSCQTYFADANATQKLAFWDVYSIPCPHSNLRHYAEGEEGEHSGAGYLCIEHWECQDCYMDFADAAATEYVGNVYTIPCPHNNLQHRAEGETSSNGNLCIEHWYCQDCYQYFSDSAATQNLSYYQVYTVSCSHNNLIYYAQGKWISNGKLCIAHWYCQDCERHFADAAATQELTQDELFSISCSHNNLRHYEEGDSSNNSGYLCIEHWFCSDCYEYFADANATQELTYDQVYSIPCPHSDLGHFAEGENGSGGKLCVEHWYCRKCWQYFADAAATQKLTYDQVFTLPCPHASVSFVKGMAPMCGGTGRMEYWECHDCGQYFADEEATQPRNYDQLTITSPYSDHAKLYNVSFADEGNGHAWLSTTSYFEKECQEKNGITVAQKFASDGYTAFYCNNCKQVVIEKDGAYQRPKDLNLFVCPIPELAGAVKLPTLPEGLATGEKWVAIANYLNAIYAFSSNLEGESGFVMLLLSIAFATLDDYYYNEATQELFSVDQYGEVKSVPTVVLRTVGDEENAIALPSSSEGLAAGEKWFDAASFYQHLTAGEISESAEAFVSQFAAAKIYLSPDGSTVYAKGCNTELAEYLEDEGAPTDELAAMLNGGNWFIPLNVFFQSQEGETLFNILDYVKTVEGGECAHVWNDGPVTKNATCTEAGIRTFTCTNGCGATREDIIPALGHDWGEGMVDKKPTITETGVCVYTCNRCKTTKSVTVPKMDPTPLVNELKTKEDLKDIKDDATVFFDAEANLPADTVFDYEILAQSKYLQVFDLTLTSGGKKVEPEAPVWVKLPIPQGWNPNWISVWHGDEKLPSFAEGGYVYFLTTHFSEFQVKYEEQKPEEPKPDNNDNNDNTDNQPSGKVCKFCGQVHTGFFQKIIGFFHSILALFGLKKK